MLKPRGSLLVTTPHHGPLTLLRLALSPRAFQRHFDPRSDHVRFFSPVTLGRLLDDLGFEVARARRGGRPRARAQHDPRAGDALVRVRHRHDVRAARAQRHRGLPRAADRRAARGGRRRDRGRRRASARRRPGAAWAARATSPATCGGRRSGCRGGRWAEQRRRHPPSAAGVRPARAVPAGDHRPRPRLRAPARLLRARLPALGVAHAPARRAPRRRGRLRLADDALATCSRAGAASIRRGSSSRCTAPARSRRRGAQDSAATHFLYIGDDEPRKNLALLLDAHARYRAAAGAAALELVLAGRARPPRQPGVRTEPAPDLPALLAGAAALVHPALHEGFGLTPLEAMHAGVPVIAARSPGLAETCAGAALYVDPYDAEGLGHQLARVAGGRGAAGLPGGAWARARRRVLLAGLGACPHRGLYAGPDDGRPPPELRRSPSRLVKVAILGTRGIPASYSGFETAAEQLASRLTAARSRGDRLLPPARRRPAPEGAQGRAPGAHPGGAQQVPRHVLAHPALLAALRAAAAARRRPVLHRRQQPDVPRHARRRDPDGHQRRRAGLRPLEVARAGQGLPALRRAQRAALVGHGDHRLARGRRDLRAALRPAHRRRALRRRGPRPRRHRDARPARPRAGQVRAVRRPPGAREQPARARRGVQPHLGRARARDEARRRRRRAVRARLHQAGPARRRPARAVSGLRLRPRLLGAAAPRLRLLRADRGRRHAPGHPRGAGGGQLRARQRPRAERRDRRRRRADVRGQGRRAVAHRAARAPLRRARARRALPGAGPRAGPALLVGRGDRRVRAAARQRALDGRARRAAGRARRRRFTSCPPSGSANAYGGGAAREGRDPRHARHPGLLQRLRDGRRAARQPPHRSAVTR